MSEGKEKRSGGRVAAGVGGAAAALVLLYFGAGHFGLGPGAGLLPGSEAKPAEAAQAEENQPTVSVAAGIEIRVQGREYNYNNVTYGNAEHSLEDLVDELGALPKGTPVTLIVEDSAAKNAVDDLKDALTAAGFTDIRE